MTNDHSVETNLNILHFDLILGNKQQISFLLCLLRFENTKTAVLKNILSLSELLREIVKSKGGPPDFLTILTEPDI